MSPLDILSALPPFRDWPPAEVLASPAWAIPGRFGEEPCTMRVAGEPPADALRLAVRFGEDPAALALADSEAFPELHALWPSRADVPPAILLALVEKECGPLLQFLENAAGLQLSIAGLETPAADAAGATGEGTPVTASAGAGHAWPSRAFALQRESGDSICSFDLSLPPALLSSFGELRHLDPAHPSIRGIDVPAVVQIAEPEIPSADLEALAPGDHLLLPEVAESAAAPEAPEDAESAAAPESPAGQAPSCPSATYLLAGRLAASPSGLAPWTDAGALRIVLADPATLALGDLLDLASGALDHSSLVARRPPLRADAALALQRGPSTLAAGRLSSVAAHPSFEIETVPPRP